MLPREHESQAPRPEKLLSVGFTMLPSYRNQPVSRIDCTNAMSPRTFCALPSSTKMRASSGMGMVMAGVIFCFANHEAI